MREKIRPIEIQKAIPDLAVYGDLINPTLYSPNSPFVLQFAQTRESLMDVDVYRNFLYSAITALRQSEFYKHYKAYLISLGINKCQMHPNIVADEDGPATLELHHHVITILDMALLITEHVLNTYGSITSFDLEELLRQAHKDNQLNVVFLCKTCHELYHNNSNGDFKLPFQMGFGKPFELLDKYKFGITRDFAMKLYFQLKNDLYNIDERDEKIVNLLKIRDNVIKWSDDNDKYFNR